MGYRRLMDLRLPTEPISYWLADCPPPAYDPTAALPDVDVAVVGGGIAGITTAYLLKRAGHTVALIEARRLLDGVTGRTTAKVSAQHGLIYAELRDRFDLETAAAYGAGQIAALDWLRGEVTRLGVDCQWADRDSYVYVEEAGQRDRLRR
jgi:glycine/D-amino acid oxidase-like deaminating enzyme